MDDPNDRHLGTIRVLLRMLSDTVRPAKGEPSTAEILLQDMFSCTEFGGMAADAASYLMQAGEKADSILSTAKEHTKWLNDQDMVDALKTSSFDMNELVEGRVSLYLVLPADCLKIHGRFLRLFVRCAISVIMRNQIDDGQPLGARTLMILDEAYALGKISEIQTALGLMPGYGLHLWSIWQNLDQLYERYGRDGAQSFFAGSDVISVFSIDDDTTAEWVSKRIGKVSPDDVIREAEALANQRETSDDWRRFWAQMAQDQGTAAFTPNYALQAYYDLLKARIGTPRIAPEEVRQYLAKQDGDSLARRMFVFRKGRVHELTPYGYFQDSPMRSTDVRFDAQVIPDLETGLFTRLRQAWR